MKRTFKYYLKSTEIQKQKLDQTLKLCWWLHNHLLEQFRAREQRREKQPTEYQLITSLPKIKQEHPNLKKVHSSNLQEASKEVYKRWQKYKELKKLDSKKGYPKFRPVHRYNSFSYALPLERNDCGLK